MWLSEIFDKSIGSIKRSYRAWLGVAVISGLLTLPTIFALPQGSETVDISAAGWASAILAALLNILISPGLLAMGMVAANGEPISLDLILKKAHLALKFFGFSLLYGIAVIAGFVALIIPGIYLMVRFGFTPLIILQDEKIGVFDAMKRSGDIAKGNYMNILFNSVIIFLVTTTLVMIGSIIIALLLPQETVAAQIVREALFVLPASVLLPVGYIAYAVIYRNLKKTSAKKKK